MKPIVMGGGVIGTSIAAQLAEAGGEVTLITSGRLGDGASGRSLAWLNSFWSIEPAYQRIRTLGIDRYRSLAARREDAADHLAFDGGLTWAPVGDRGHRAHFPELRDTGYAVEWLAPDQVSTVTPGVDPAAINPDGAAWAPGEGWVDLPWLIRLLADRLVAAGGEILTGRGRCRPIITQGRVIGVQTAAGDRHDADVVVIATGPSGPGMLAQLGVTVPDATPAAALVMTGPVEHRLRAVLNTPRVAIRPAPGGRLAMDSAWSEEAVTIDEQGTASVTDDVVRGLLAEGSAVLEGHPVLRAASVGVGLKPVPGGDGQSIVGAVPGVDGAHVVFTHSGATLGLILGELLAGQILDDRVHPLLAPFGVDRYVGVEAAS